MNSSTPSGHAAAPTHARRHAHAQARAQDPGRLPPRRAQLAAFLRRSPDTATVEDLRRFQLHLVDRGTSPITLNATITGLKFFFDVTLGRGELMAKMQPVQRAAHAAGGAEPRGGRAPDRRGART